MRTVIAIILSVALGLFCFLSKYNLDTVADDITDDIKTVEELVKQGKIDGAISKIDRLEKEWIKNEIRLAIYIDHDLLEDIGVSLSSLKSLAKTEDKSFFYAETAELTTKFIHMKDINSFSYRNFI